MSNQSLNVYGYDPYEQGWYLWQKNVPGVPSVVSGLTSGQVAALNSHTIQGLIELLYVRVANDTLYSGLNGLDVALEKTSRTLELLSALQEFHNAVMVSSKGSLSAWFVYNGLYPSTSDYQSAYNAAASAFFGLPVFPDFIFGNENSVVDIRGKSTSFATFAENLYNLKQQLRSDLAELLSIDPSSDDDSSSLYTTTKQVLCDLPPDQNGSITWTDAKLWALDYYTVDDGKDFAQAQDNTGNNKQTVLKVTSSFRNWVIPMGTDGDGGYYYRTVSFSKANNPGMGTGVLEGDIPISSAGGPVKSIRVGPTDLTSSDTPQHMPISDGSYFEQSPTTAMPGQSGGGQHIKTFYLTFSGNFGFETYEDSTGGTNVRVIALNPVDQNGNVVNPIVSGYTGSAAERGAQGQNAGIFQQNITTAISSAQNLNTTQTQTVQSYLNTFEQYYKSASSMLNSMTSLITKFAQNIRPS